MATYYQVVIKYDKMQENGSVKRASEKYIADALFAQIKSLSKRESNESRIKVSP